MKTSITADELRTVIEYNEESGEFRWRARLSQGTQVGQIAGCLNTIGYWQIGIRRVRYLGHRLAWLYVYGVWPLGEIDHIDGDRGNNRIANLRVTNRSVNMQNVTRTNKKTQTGLLGAHVDKNGFSSKIMLDGMSMHLGNFKTAQEAHEAYVRAKRKIHEGNTL